MTISTTPWLDWPYKTLNKEEGTSSEEEEPPSEFYITTRFDCIFDIPSEEDIWDMRIHAWRHMLFWLDRFDAYYDEFDLASWHPTFQLAAVLELTLIII